MRNKEYFKGKKVTIVGLARSGIACSNLLHSLGAEVRVTDIKDCAQTKEAMARLGSGKIECELGKHSPEFIRDSDLVVVSPGVPKDSSALMLAARFNKPVIGEIEVASRLCPAEIIAVTGANGKTTVTTLIGMILKEAGRNVYVCGNIGNPFSGQVSFMQEKDFAVLEISSFQLETIRDFKPKVALILNLTANHLDRYLDMQEYFEAKKRIFLNQDQNDFLVINSDDPALSGIQNEARAKVVFFSKQEGLNLNQSAVLKVGQILGIESDLVSGVFSRFKGIEHRMEELQQIKGVRFINDSKATTADSAIWALKNINAPVILIAGGRHKGIDYRVILNWAKDKVKKAILIGEAKERIARQLEEQIQVETASSLDEAVNKAFSQSKPGYCVLFSPMCSSFDMFSDYEERGRVFKKIVSDLASANN